MQDLDIRPLANDLNSKAGDLAQISSLGYFLRGSSVALGLTKVTESCETIQSYVPEKDESVTLNALDKAECLSKIGTTLVIIKEECAEVEKVLKPFYSR